MTSSFPGTEPAPGLVVSTHLRTAAGSPLPVEVTLTNNASAPRVLAVGALGVDAAWLPAPVRTAVLEPAESVVVTLVVSPTQGTVPAQYPFAFTVQALDPATGRPSGAAAVMVDTTLIVNPRNQLKLELRPRSTSTVSSRKVKLALRNMGNEPARVTLDVKTSPRVRVRFRKKLVEVLPGATELVSGRATVTHRRLFGGTEHHTYTVSASGTESLRHVEGSVTQHPLVGTMLMKAVALLAVLAIWIGAAVIFIPQLAHRIGDRSSETTTTQEADAGKDADGGGDNGGADDSGDSGDSGSGGSAGDEGDQGGDGKSGGKGGTQQAADVPEDEIALTGTVAGDQPAGVRVSLAPTSLVDEDAQGGVGVGVPSSALAKSGMSPASSFLNRALPSTPKKRTVTTTKDGSWAFPSVKKPGYYLVTFTKAGFQKQSFVVDSTSEASTEPLEVDLAAGEGTLSGTVTGPNGKVGGATVTITDGANTITTSSNSRGQVGHWMVKGLSTPGAYVVQAMKPGLSSESRMVDLGAGGTATADLRLEHGVASLTGRARSVNESGELAGTGGITVTVTGDDGVVRTATTLTQGEKAARSSARVAAAFVGSYTVPGLPAPGAYVVTVSGPGMQTQTTKVKLKPGQSRASVDADLVPSSGSVAGTIKGVGRNGKASEIVGAGLTLTNADNTYKTMSTSQPLGSFLFDGVVPGTYSLQTQFFGYPTDRVTVTVRAGATLTINRNVGNIVDGVPALSSLQGNAIDASNSLPVTCADPAACLTATVVGPDDDPYSTRFLPTEQFTLPEKQLAPDGSQLPGPRLRPGLHKLTVSAPHYSPATTTVRVGTDAVVNIGTLGLLPAPKMIGTLTTVVGSPQVRNPAGPAGSTLAANTCIWAVPATDSDPVPAGCDVGGTASECQAGTATFVPGDTRVCAYVRGTGDYSIEVPKEGTYKIHVNSADSEYLSPSVTDTQLESGVTRNQSFVLNRYGRLSVTVYRPGPQGVLVPAGGAEVDLRIDQDDPMTPPIEAETGAAGTTQFVKLASNTYFAHATVSDGDAALEGFSVATVVGLNQERTARVVAQRPLPAVIGRVVSSYDGNVVPVGKASVKVTAPTGYDDNGSAPIQGTVAMTTQDGTGCFLIEETGSASPAVPGTGGCTWPGPSVPPTADPSRGKQTFLSPAASSVEVTMKGYAPVTQTNTTLLTADDTVNTFTLTPRPVSLGTVVPEADPKVNPETSPFDWSQVHFDVEPLAGSTNQISVAAVGTGAGTGRLTWLDGRLGVADQVTPGTYEITATRAGFQDGTGTLKCQVATTDAIADKACDWVGAAPKLIELAKLRVTAMDGAAALDGATYTLKLDEVVQKTVVGTPGGVTFTGLDPAETHYTVGVRAAGYRFADAPAAMRCPSLSSEVALSAGRTTACTVEMTRLGTITGTITGAPEKPPGTAAVTSLAGVAVTIVECTAPAAPSATDPCTEVDSASSFSGITRDDGTFRITGSTSNEGIDHHKNWLVQAAAPGYSMPPASRPGAEQGTLVVPADFAAGSLVAADRDVAMALTPVTFSVRLLESGSTTGFKRAHVQLYTQTSGGAVLLPVTAVLVGDVYQFTGVVPGAYTIAVRGGGLMFTTQDDTVRQDGQIITVPVTRAANPASGTITSDNPGGGLLAADVSLCTAPDPPVTPAPADLCATTALGTTGAPLTAKTDAAGKFNIQGVPDGAFYVKVAKPGYGTQVLSVAYDFDHETGPRSSIDVQLVAVTRRVLVTLDPLWDGDNLNGSTVKLTNGSTTMTGSTTLTSDGQGGWVATIEQVRWGCWTVSVDLPSGHYGTMAAPTGIAPADSTQSCDAGKLTVSKSEVTDPTTATVKVDEGLVSLKTKATVDPTFGHTAPVATVVSLKRGATTYLNARPVNTGDAVEIWLPTGFDYDATAALASPDDFWSGAADVVRPAGTGNGGAPTSLELELELKELHATLVVNVTGLAGGEAELHLTGPSGETAPVDTQTESGSQTFKLPRGDWTVTATVATPGPSRSDSDDIEITSPDGSYTINLAIPPRPATGATAGTPGTFTPAAAAAPANLASLTGVAASPTTPWTTGQRVVLADSSTASWNGTAWVAGAAP